MRWCFACLSLAAAVAGCDPAPATQLVIPIEPDAEQPLPDAGADDVEEADAEGGPDGRDSSASSSSVVVGLGPTPQVQDGGTGALEQLDAVLLSLASGARGITLQLRWEELDATSPNSAAAWQRLEAIAAVVRTHKRTLLLTVNAVEATLDRRPEHLRKLAWDSTLVTEPMHALVGKVFSKLGPELAYLSVGFEVDRFVEAHASQREEFAVFGLDAMQFANTHPERKSSRTTVTWSVRGGGRNGSPAGWVPELVEASDVLMVSYAPMGDNFRATPADSIPGELDRMVQLAGGKPLVIADLGYPSSDLIGSSEQAQAEFVARLLQEVEARRSAVAFVGWTALHDPAAQTCQARAAAHGHPDSLELYVYWCSTGLRSRQGVAKASFDVFRAGAAGLMDP